MKLEELEIENAFCSWIRSSVPVIQLFFKGCYKAEGLAYLPQLLPIHHAAFFRPPLFALPEKAGILPWVLIYRASHTLLFFFDPLANVCQSRYLINLLPPSLEWQFVLNGRKVQLDGHEELNCVLCFYFLTNLCFNQTSTYTELFETLFPQHADLSKYGAKAALFFNNAAKTFGPATVKIESAIENVNGR